MKRYDISREEQKSHELSKSDSRVLNTIIRYTRRAEHIGYIKQLFPEANKVLCLGCRHESEVDHFLARGFDVLGLDFAAPDSEFIKNGDAHELMTYFDENQFDIVYASHSMEHMHEAPLVLENIRKVASMGSFIVLPSKSDLGKSHCSVFDIMSAAESGLEYAGLFWNNELLDDFSSLLPYELAFFKNMDYHIPPGKFMEIGLGFKW